MTVVMTTQHIAEYFSVSYLIKVHYFKKNSKKERKKHQISAAVFSSLVRELHRFNTLQYHLIGFSSAHLNNDDCSITNEL